jgi:hypothetical protein
MPHWAPWLALAFSPPGGESGFRPIAMIEIAGHGNQWSTLRINQTIRSNAFISAALTTGLRKMRELTNQAGREIRLNSRILSTTKPADSILERSSLWV